MTQPDDYYREKFEQLVKWLRAKERKADVAAEEATQMWTQGTASGVGRMASRTRAWIGKYVLDIDAEDKKEDS